MLAHAAAHATKALGQRIDARLGLGLEGLSEESYVICVRLGAKHEKKLSTREC